MNNNTQTYQEIAPLCGKDHVSLVRGKNDGSLYVRKELGNCSTDVFCQLMTDPIENAPEIKAIQRTETGIVVIEEYLAGSTIAEKISNEGLFSEKETLDIMLQLCRIVSAMHSRKPAIIHRDIKPSNIIISPDGKVKLLDFGAAKLMTSGSRDTVLLGTEGYAAPEQYGFSASSPQTDIYALGVLMNVCLTGQLPLQRTAPGKLSSIIRRCTAIDPKDRYANAKELSRALKRAGKTFANWLPPGFRTMKIYKMIPALAFYILFPIIVLCLDPIPGDPDALLQVQLSITVSVLLQLIFVTDYLGLRKHFPFMAFKQRWLRFLGTILSPLVCFIMGILFSLLCEFLFM